MKSLNVRQIARILNILVYLTLLCNLIALPLIPPLVYWRENPFQLAAKQALAGDLLPYWTEGLSKVWSDPYTTMLALFLLFSGLCTAFILRQGQRVLQTILRGEPFSSKNASFLRRAALSSFLVSGAALIRLLCSLIHAASLRPLTTYNALFIPLFALFGLLCLIMSTLFQQAEEMKEEHDLTI